MKLHRYVDHQRLHIVTKDVISLSISVLLLFRHYIQGFLSGVSGAVIRPLSQWQMPTFFPNLNKKNPNQKVIFM